MEQQVGNSRQGNKVYQLLSFVFIFVLALISIIFLLVSMMHPDIEKNKHLFSYSNQWILAQQIQQMKNYSFYYQIRGADDKDYDEGIISLIDDTNNEKYDRINKLQIDNFQKFQKESKNMNKTKSQKKNINSNLNSASIYYQSHIEQLSKVIEQQDKKKQLFNHLLHDSPLVNIDILYKNGQHKKRYLNSLQNYKKKSINPLISIKPQTIQIKTFDQMIDKQYCQDQQSCQQFCHHYQGQANINTKICKLPMKVQDICLVVRFNDSKVFYQGGCYDNNEQVIYSLIEENDENYQTTITIRELLDPFIAVQKLQQNQMSMNINFFQPSLINASKQFFIALFCLLVVYLIFIGLYNLNKYKQIAKLSQEQNKTLPVGFA